MHELRDGQQAATGELRRPAVLFRFQVGAAIPLLLSQLPLILEDETTRLGELWTTELPASSTMRGSWEYSARSVLGSAEKRTTAP